MHISEAVAAAKRVWFDTENMTQKTYTSEV
jgi:hypothetical protein